MWQVGRAAALAQALQAREDTFESDRELAKKLQEELNGPVRMAPSKRKAAAEPSQATVTESQVAPMTRACRGASATRVAPARRRSITTPNRAALQESPPIQPMGLPHSHPG